MNDQNQGGQNAASAGNSDAFRLQVQALVVQGKLTPEEAADLLGEGVETFLSAPQPEASTPVGLNKPAAEPQPASEPTPATESTQRSGFGGSIPNIPGLSAAAPMIGKLVSKLVKEVAPHAEGDTPDDLRLEIAGYSLIVSRDETLSAPTLSGDTDGLTLSSSHKGWKLNQQHGLRFGNRRVTLSVPFAPRHVRAELAGGQLVLPDVLGELQVEVAGGNVRVGNVGHLKAEVNGGNLTAGEVGGNLHLEINGGNGKIGRSQTLIAEVNGGMLNWSGLLKEGQHRLEVNGGGANLNLEVGSSVQLSAEVTVGQLVSTFSDQVFPIQKRGGMLNATYTGTLGSGAAGLSCQVSAGQVQLNVQEIEGGVTHA
ncbi:hypothetical protein FNU79_04640 [Deinococcus detaillensis]|uniref:Adhesin domain-containing protein n=1 Tax=Deinococcus detaillensis TaxID=2592048 RepID=A0A553V469_9DEIO|nr:hypothetical protein [Deinococcus detaillensis]TSA87184.1 hypothetical protein FNU79_04640 [Deinococcus detaillensis]